MNGVFMNMITAEPERIQVQYTGYFAEPAFSVLGNPARLYTNLLRHLEPFGANVNSLSINLSVLAQANASCLLTAGVVRVWIDRVEVFLQDVQSQKEFAQLVSNTWSVMAETDESLRPVRHAVTLDAWARLKGEAFGSYIRRFLKTPPNVSRWKPSVQFKEIAEDGANIGSVHLEEAVHIPDGLFLRSVVELGAAAPDVGELIPRFMDRLSAQLRSLDLDLPLKVE